MNETSSVRQLLHQILANKSKSRISSEQFDNLLEKADELDKISEKGLFIAMMSEQLHKISNVNYSAIKKFLNDFLTGLKPERARKQRQGRGTRRRRRPRDNTNVAHNLDKMVEESNSNPSNIQERRREAEKGSQQDSQRIKESNSKKSDQIGLESKKDLEYAKQLNKISEGIEFGSHFYDQPEQPIQQLSIGSSTSSQSFGMVSNLSQKLDLLKPKETKQETKPRTTKRGQPTITKRKMPHGLGFDQMLTLEKTKATLLGQSFSEQKSLSYEYSPSLNQYNNNLHIFQAAEMEYINQIKDKPIISIEKFLLSLKKIDESDEFKRKDQFQHEIADYATAFQQETTFDFISQPLPQNTNQLVKEEMPIQELNIFKYQTSTPTLKQIGQKLKKPESLVFYEMLSRMQLGEVKLYQEKPEEFSPITVALLNE